MVQYQTIQISPRIPVFQSQEPSFLSEIFKGYYYFDNKRYTLVSKELNSKVAIVQEHLAKHVWVQTLIKIILFFTGVAPLVGLAYLLANIMDRKMHEYKVQIPDPALKDNPPPPNDQKNEKKPPAAKPAAQPPNNTTNTPPPNPQPARPIEPEVPSGQTEDKKPPAAKPAAKPPAVVVDVPPPAPQTILRPTLDVVLGAQNPANKETEAPSKITAFDMGVYRLKQTRAIDPRDSRGYKEIALAASKGNAEAIEYKEYLDQLRFVHQRMDISIHERVLELMNRTKHAKAQIEKDQKILKAEEKIKKAKDAEFETLLNNNKNKEDPQKSLEIALHYYKEGDDKNAYIYFEKSAKGDNAIAMRYCGECLEHGRGVDRDWNAAFAMYRKAALKDDLESICRVGDKFAFGRGSNTTNLSNYLWSTVDQHPEALYKRNFAPSEFYQLAFKLYKQAADKDYMPAKIRLARLYGLGGVDVPADRWQEKKLQKEYSERWMGSLKYAV